MAHQATTWAYQLPIRNVTQKFILVALADMADEAFTCFPGQDKLADMTGAGVRSVQRALSELEAMGLIRREERRRSDGYRTSDRYFLNVGAELKSHPPQSQVTNCHLTSETTSPANLTDLTRHSGGYIEEELSVELPEESPVILADDFETFWQAYPRKVAKLQARKAFTSALKREASGEILAGVARYAADPNLPEREFIPHPATWLNGDRWADEPLPPRRGSEQPNKAQQRQDQNLAMIAQLARIDASRARGIGS